MSLTPDSPQGLILQKQFVELVIPFAFRRHVRMDVKNGFGLQKYLRYPFSSRRILFWTGGFDFPQGRRGNSVVFRGTFVFVFRTETAEDGQT